MRPDLFSLERLTSWQFALSRNDALPQFLYAVWFWTKSGDPNSRDVARYLKVAADQNLAHAQFMYGQCLQDGCTSAQSNADLLDVSVGEANEDVISVAR